MFNTKIQAVKKIIDLLILVITLLVYSSVFIPPDRFWPAGFISYLIPNIILLNILILAFRLNKINLTVVYPLLALITGSYFLKNSLSFNKNEDPGTIKVLTYNTKVFNVYKDNGKDFSAVKKMIDWIALQHADIMCFQEFYNSPKSNFFNTIDRLNSRSEYFVFQKPLFTNRSGNQIGAIIFSKYPIMQGGVLNFMEETYNNVIYTDLLIGKDTIRVYNMHLQSMHIDEDNMIYAEDYQVEFKNLTTRLKYGFIQRAEQIRQLKAHMKNCPYPILLCGDLNDIPYSYAYRELDEVLNNGFTSAGHGFGFTYNGKIFFLRIDNLFFSDYFKIHTFNTHREIKESDHFPISATYSLKEN